MNIQVSFIIYKACIKTVISKNIQTVTRTDKSEQALRIIGHVVAESYANVHFIITIW
jgi:hypothetical protein